MGRREGRRGEKGVGARGREGSLLPGGRSAGTVGVAALSLSGCGPGPVLRTPAPCGTDWDPGPDQAGEQGGGGAGGRGRRRPSHSEPAGWCSEAPPPPLPPRPGRAARFGCGPGGPPRATSFPPAFTPAGEQPPEKPARSPRVLGPAAERGAGPERRSGTTSALPPLPACSAPSPSPDSSGFKSPHSESSVTSHLPGLRA